MAKVEKVEFENRRGKTLAARLDLPDQGEPAAYAVFAHCFSCSKNTKAAHGVSRHLAGRGIATLRFDFTGLGESEGDFANTNFSSNISDLKCAAEWLGREHQAPALLVGHSLGGAACLMAALDLPSVKAVATIGSPADAEHVTRQFGAKLDKIEEEGSAEVDLAGRAFRIERQFLDDIEGHQIEEAAARLSRALLICHSPLDAQVGVDNASRLFLAARHPKSFLSLDNADHLLSNSADAEYAAEVIAAWGSRYVGGGVIGPEKGAAPEPLDEGPEKVLVEETGEGKFHTRITAGKHSFVADEPRRVGGDDAGPDPYELLVAGLGACTSMTLRMYADRKKWPLKRVGVSLHHVKDYSDDCEGCVAGQPQKIDIITREIRLEGELDEDQRARLLEIADRCPVHQTLHSPVSVKTVLKS